METFTELKEFTDDPHYLEKRQEYLGKLNLNTIDAPIADLISGFAQLPYCFTLQSCYGHFLHGDQKNPANLEPLPISSSILTVEYRIAYIALCIQNNVSGRSLFEDLAKIPAIDPAYVQFGCADWFWKTDPNTYVLQVEPQKYMYKDKALIEYHEALHIEKTKREFFNALEKLINKRLSKSG
ncbi:MAG: hypothetical protein FJ004_00875 [Chloroflexi bacterium]|nr:hypothetical protein [Chloroflexota bacterium]